jgi:hypothetical protein
MLGRRLHERARHRQGTTYLPAQPRHYLLSTNRDAKSLRGAGVMDFSCGVDSNRILREDGTMLGGAAESEKLGPTRPFS